MVGDLLVYIIGYHLNRLTDDVTTLLWVCALVSLVLVMSYSNHFLLMGGDGLDDAFDEMLPLLHVVDSRRDLLGGRSMSWSLASSRDSRHASLGRLGSYGQYFSIDAASNKSNSGQWSSVT